MSDRAKMAQYLRERAARFRRLAKACATPMSSRVLEVARDLDAQADGIERRQGSRGDFERERKS